MEENSVKKYRVGMFGGKFMPIHKGHVYCVDTAAELCDKVYWILFYGGEEEGRIFEGETALDRSEYTVETRRYRMKGICDIYDNVEYAEVDVSALKNPDGTDNWELETPYVLDICGIPDAVFAGSDRHREYFEAAYPGTTVVAVDPERETYPISGTKVRNMVLEEALEWLVIPIEN